MLMKDFAFEFKNATYVSEGKTVKYHKKKTAKTYTKNGAIDTTE